MYPQIFLLRFGATPLIFVATRIYYWFLVKFRICPACPAMLLLLLLLWPKLAISNGQIWIWTGNHVSISSDDSHDSQSRTIAAMIASLAWILPVVAHSIIWYDMLWYVMLLGRLNIGWSSKSFPKANTTNLRSNPQAIWVLADDSAHDIDTLSASILNAQKWSRSIRCHKIFTKFQEPQISPLAFGW